MFWFVINVCITVSNCLTSIGNIQPLLMIIMHKKRQQSAVLLAMIKSKTVRVLLVYFIQFFLFCNKTKEKRNNSKIMVNESWILRANWHDRYPFNNHYTICGLNLKKKIKAHFPNFIRLNFKGFWRKKKKPIGLHRMILRKEILYPAV